MPASHVRLSAGRTQMSDELQALCFMAGANSIFVGAKLLTTATHLAALRLFSLKGHVWWQSARPLALANVLGSVLGTRLALRHGAGFVRGVFILVVSALILKTGYDAFLR